MESQPVEAQLEEQVAQGTLALWLYEATASTPWWIVSVLLHALVIVLCGLISASMALPEPPEGFRVTVPLEPTAPQILPVIHQPRNDDPLNYTRTDPESTKVSPVFVPAELLPYVQLDEKFLNFGPKNNEQDPFGRENVRLYDLHGRDDDPGSNSVSHQGLLEVIGTANSSNIGDAGLFGGFGVDPGKGKGTFGTRTGGGQRAAVERFNWNPDGRAPRTEIPRIRETMELGLRWLAYHQEADGHWDSLKYGGKKVDTANTAFALLAFLGAGHTEKSGEYKDNVRRAVAWLKSKQTDNGLVFDTTDEGGHRGVGYPHAIATMALVEAAGMAKLSDTQAAAQKAVDYCLKVHQHGQDSDRLGFRYAAKTAGDLSVTGWYVMALKSAKICGLKVDALAFDGIMRFLDQVEVKNADAQGSYGPASRYSYQPGAATNHRRGAIGNLCRQFLGWKREDLQSSVELFVKDGGLPSYGANGQSVDLYYWYYGTFCTFQQGGEIWKQWNQGIKNALLNNQCAKGDEAGSWNPVGAFCEEWGRVGQTALSALCLEVYWRYDVMK